MEPVVWCRSWGVEHTLPAAGLESSWEGNKTACNKTHTKHYGILSPLHEKGHCQCVQGFSYMNSVTAARSISQERSKTTNHIEKVKFWKHLELDREKHFPSVSWTGTILEHCPPQLGQWCHPQSPLQASTQSCTCGYGTVMLSHVVFMVLDRPDECLLQ